MTSLKSVTSTALNKRNFPLLCAVLTLNSSNLMLWRPRTDSPTCLKDGTSFFIQPNNVNKLKIRSCHLM